MISKLLSLYNDGIILLQYFRWSILDYEKKGLFLHGLYIGTRLWKWSDNNMNNTKAEFPCPNVDGAFKCSAQYFITHSLVLPEFVYFFCKFVMFSFLTYLFTILYCLDLTLKMQFYGFSQITRIRNYFYNVSLDFRIKIISTF